MVLNHIRDNCLCITHNSYIAPHSPVEYECGKQAFLYSSEWSRIRILKHTPEYVLWFLTCHMSLTYGALYVTHAYPIFNSVYPLKNEALFHKTWWFIIHIWHSGVKREISPAPWAWHFNRTKNLDSFVILFYKLLTWESGCLGWHGGWLNRRNGSRLFWDLTAMCVSVCRCVGPTSRYLALLITLPSRPLRAKWV